MTTCFFTNICELFQCFCEAQRYTASCGDRVDIRIGCTFFLLKSRQVSVSTLLLSLPWLAPTIFRHFRHKNNHLVSTTLSRPYCTLAPKNAESYGNRRSNHLPKTNANPHFANSRPNPSKHTPPSITKT